MPHKLLPIIINPSTMISLSTQDGIFPFANMHESINITMVKLENTVSVNFAC